MGAVYRLPFINPWPGPFPPSPWLGGGNWDSPIGPQALTGPHGIGQPFAWDILFLADPNGFYAGLYAARAGTVIDLRNNYVGSSCGDPNYPDAGPGNYVTLRHADNTILANCHMKQGSVAVSVGQYVEQGTKLGDVGATGNVCPPGTVHVHTGALSRINIGTIGDFTSHKYGVDVIAHFEDTAPPTSPTFHANPWRPLAEDAYNWNPLMYRQDGWRFCTQCAGLIFAYQGSDGVCPATGGTHKYRTPPLGSRNYTLSDDAEAPGEPNWKYCRKCHVLFYALWPGSRCPVTTPTNQHDPSASGNYRIIKNVSSDPGQHGWRLCSNCKAMFYVNAIQSKCPYQGGTHVPWYGDYSLHMSYEEHQRDWRYCSRCKGLFLKTDASNGVCAAGGGHSAAGNNYILAMDVNPININATGPQAPIVPPAFTGWHLYWRFCYKCRLLFYGPNTRESSCPAGGAHFGGSQPTYYLVVFQGTGVGGLGQSGWRWCMKCQGLYFPNPGSVCSASGGGGHVQLGSVNIVLSNDTFP